MKRQVAKIQQQLPPCVGYDLGNAVILIDALGERKTLPMEFCLSQDVRQLHTSDHPLMYDGQELHITLVRLFNGKIGQDHVERQDYSISTEDGNSMIAANNWGDFVKKGGVIVMSMIVKKVALRTEYSRRQRNACPRCYETSVGVMRDDGWLKWYVIILTSIY